MLLLRASAPASPTAKRRPEKATQSRSGIHGAILRFIRTGAPAASTTAPIRAIVRRTPSTSSAGRLRRP